MTTPANPRPQGCLRRVTAACIWAEAALGVAFFVTSGLGSGASLPLAGAFIAACVAGLSGGMAIDRARRAAGQAPWTTNRNEWGRDLLFRDDLHALRTNVTDTVGWFNAITHRGHRDRSQRHL